jgi:hypothetical protein
MGKELVCSCITDALYLSSFFDLAVINPCVYTQNQSNGRLEMNVPEGAPWASQAQLDDAQLLMNDQLPEGKSRQFMAFQAALSLGLTPSASIWHSAFPFPKQNRNSRGT